MVALHALAVAPVFCVKATKSADFGTDHLGIVIRASRRFALSPRVMMSLVWGEARLKLN